MQIDKVLAGVAVRDLEQSRRWYERFFGRPADAEPMEGLTEWHTPGGVLQLVADERRAGGSLVTIWVADVRTALAELAARAAARRRRSTTPRRRRCSSRRSPTTTATRSPWSRSDRVRGSRRAAAS